MSLISEPDRSRLRHRFGQELDGAVRIRLTRHEAGGACRVCALSEELMTELAALSDALTLETSIEHEPGYDAPSITLAGRSRGRVRFHGLPSGFELPAFIDSIVDVSRGSTGIGDEARARLARLDRDQHIRVFTTAT